MKSLFSPTKLTPYIILSAFFLFGFYLRLDAYLYAPDIPYGLRDAAFNYQVGKAIFEGKSPDYLWNGLGKNLRHGRFYYPPLPYYLPAYAARLTGDYQGTVYVVNAFMSSLAILTVFLLVRELFGEYPALASSLFIAFSVRDVSNLTWGQWQTAYSLAFVPLILYFGLKSLKEPRNLYWMSISAGLCFLTYPQTAAYSLLSALLFALIRWKRIPWGMNQMITSLFLFLVVISPMLPTAGMLITHAESEGGTKRGSLIDNVFSWYPSDYMGVYPQSWYLPGNIYTYFGLFLVLGGITLLILNRGREPAKTALQLLISSAAVYYLLAHIIQFTSLMRAIKLVTLEPYILAIPFAALFSPKLAEDKRIRAGAIIALVMFLAFVLPPLLNIGERLFPIGVRLTPKEMEALSWLKSDTPDRSLVVYYGYADMMLDWGTVLSDRLLLKQGDDNKFYIEDEPVTLRGDVYLLLDANMPFVEDSQKMEAFNRLTDFNRHLENISAMVYYNDEVIIRKLV